MADYDVQTWVDGAPGNTPISAARLTHMEEGIFTAQATADAGGGGSAMTPDAVNFPSIFSDGDFTVPVASHTSQNVNAFLEDDGGSVPSWLEFDPGDTFYKVKFLEDGWYSLVNGINFDEADTPGTNFFTGYEFDYSASDGVIADYHPEGTVQAHPNGTNNNNSFTYARDVFIYANTKLTIPLLYNYGTSTITVTGMALNVTKFG